MAHFVWIPESTTFPGLYAVKNGPVTRTGQNSTHNPWEARQFDSLAECRTWCEANPFPFFVPIQHGFTNDDERLAEAFTYHAPQQDDPARYEAIREAGRHLAETILRHTPKSADQSAAIRKVREAVMTANASIALQGLI